MFTSFIIKISSSYSISIFNNNHRFDRTDSICKQQIRERQNSGRFFNLKENDSHINIISCISIEQQNSYYNQINEITEQVHIVLSKYRLTSLIKDNRFLLTVFERYDTLHKRKNKILWHNLVILEILYWPDKKINIVTKRRDMIISAFIHPK